jgi:hypothetical protein
MASQSRESYSFVGYVVECRGSGHDAAPLRCSARANSGAFFIVPHIVFQLSSGISSNAAR